MSVTPKYGASAEVRERCWDADQYRARARTLRKLALWTESPEVREDLIELALRHERMADYLEAHSDGKGQERASAPE